MASRPNRKLLIIMRHTCKIYLFYIFAFLFADNVSAQIVVDQIEGNKWTKNADGSVTVVRKDGSSVTFGNNDSPTDRLRKKTLVKCKQRLNAGGTVRIPDAAGNPQLAVGIPVYAQCVGDTAVYMTKETDENGSFFIPLNSMKELKGDSLDVRVRIEVPGLEPYETICKPEKQHDFLGDKYTVRLNDIILKPLKADDDE